mgnify:CR=1 FL=1
MVYMRHISIEAKTLPQPAAQLETAVIHIILGLHHSGFGF